MANLVWYASSLICQTMDCVPLPVHNVPKPDKLTAITRTVMKIDVEYHDAPDPVL